MHFVRSGLASGAILIAGASLPAAAQSPAEFYKGKTVTIFVGLSAGGGYDTNARLVGRHIGKYIPGMLRTSTFGLPGIYLPIWRPTRRALVS